MMREPRCILAGFVAIVSASAWAADAPPAAFGTPAQAAKPWAFAVTAYPTVVRGGQNYTSGIATADRGPLHLEARVNYESIGARSAFIGWNFSGGDTLTWELTPLLGGAWGTTQAFDRPKDDSGLDHRRDRRVLRHRHSGPGAGPRHHPASRADGPAGW